jgi:steroid delta-isomerase-like uncharacterized protein
MDSYSAARFFHPALIEFLRDSGKIPARMCVLTLLCSILCSCAQAEKMNTNKRDVALWYEAFDKNDPALLDRILSDTWVDIPAPPSQPAGPNGAKQLLTELTTAFPDLRITTKEIIQDGDKVVVRSEISGTQRDRLMAFPAKNRRMTIQAIDIHEFKDGRIIRTWHTEDWLTGLHQLGVFEK